MIRGGSNLRHGHVEGDTPSTDKMRMKYLHSDPSLVIWPPNTDEVCKREHLRMPVNAHTNVLAWHGRWNDNELRAL